MTDPSRRRTRTKLPCHLALVVVFSLWSGACGDEPVRRGRVLLVGLAGASPRVVRELLGAGRVSHLAEIAGIGASGLLRSQLPLEAPPIWNSIATGKLPAQHGIRSLTVTDSDGGERLYRGGDRKTPALWNIATAAGSSVAVVNWPTTHPPEKIRGVMVSDLIPASGIGPHGRGSDALADFDASVAWPEEWVPRVRALLADTGSRTAIPDPGETALPDRPLPREVARSREQDESVVRIALSIEAEIRPDLLMLFLPGIDRVSHEWWGGFEDPDAYADPLPLSDSDRAAAREALFQYYEFTDALIGRLMERFGPDDLVLVVSDHGFEAGDSLAMGVHESDVAAEGVYFASGPGVSQPERGAPPSVNDVTPAVLTWMRLPAAADMVGRPAAFLSTAPVTPVVTYDSLRVERVGGGAIRGEEALPE